MGEDFKQVAQDFQQSSLTTVQNGLVDEAELSFALGPQYTRSLVEIMPTALFTCDHEGLITYYNQRAAELWGRRPKLHDPDERYCGSFRIYRPDGSLLPHDQCPMAVAVLTGRGARNEEIHIQRPDGSIILAAVNIDALYDDNGQCIGAINVFEDITQRKQAEAEREQLLVDLAREQERLQEVTDTLEERVAARTNEVRALAAKLALAEQAERKRIGHILHDHIQQMLFGAQVRMHLMESDLQTEHPDSMQAHLLELKELLEEAVKATRTLSVELCPPVLNSEDFSAAVEWLAEWMEETHGLQIVVDVEDDCSIPELNLRTLLFQCIRELLFNVVKHARADCGHVTLRRNGSSFVVSVCDEGRGFDATAVSSQEDNRTGLGLISIRERLQLLGGDLRIVSTPGHGTSVHVHLPLH